MMTPVSRLGLLVNFTRPHVNEGLEVLLTAARETGIALFAPSETAERIAGVTPCEPADFLAQGVQGVISLGGDGSFLAASHTLQRAHVELPLIGFNIGHLGYLTAVNEEHFATALKALATGAYKVDTRTTLAATIQKADGTIMQCPDALNDVVLSRAEGGRTIAVCLELDNCPVARWVCDGVILATPTGSTAYSLSVGGPVIVPTAKVLSVNVIAPHTLSARPLIIPEQTKVTLRVDSDRLAATVDVDGVSQSMHLKRDDQLSIALSTHVVQILMPETSNPYLPLSQKLHWGEAFVR